MLEAPEPSAANAKTVLPALTSRRQRKVRLACPEVPDTNVHAWASPDLRHRVPGPPRSLYWSLTSRDSFPVNQLIIPPDMSETCSQAIPGRNRLCVIGRTLLVADPAPRTDRKPQPCPKDGAVKSAPSPQPYSACALFASIRSAILTDYAFFISHRGGTQRFRHHILLPPAESTLGQRFALVPTSTRRRYFGVQTTWCLHLVVGFVAFEPL